MRETAGKIATVHRRMCLTRLLIDGSATVFGFDWLCLVSVSEICIVSKDWHMTKNIEIVFFTFAQR